MRGLLSLLLVLLGLLLLVPPGVPPPGPVLGYWMHADGSVTEFRRYSDGVFPSDRGRATCP